MSDNISPEEIKKRLVLFLRIPAEVWTDVLKLFSRRILVQNFAPACFRLKDICDKNVKSIHVIEKADQFNEKLEEDDPDAIKQLEHLAANKCKLAGQFRLMSTFGVYDEKTKNVLRHSLDLLQGCQLTFDINEQSADGKTIFLDDCLTILESTKPVTIQINQEEVREPDGTFWLHPTVQKCSRVVFNICPTSNANPLRTYLAISHWLHRPMECNGSVADQQQVRCMIFWRADPNHINWLLDRCSKNLQEGRQPTDRRSFVLSFVVDCDYELPNWTGFDQFRRIENRSTGEVLVLDRVIDEDEDDEPLNEYRLRRCLVKDEAIGKEFYAGMFKRDKGYEEFKIVEENKIPEVVIV